MVISISVDTILINEHALNCINKIKILAFIKNGWRL